MGDIQEIRIYARILRPSASNLSTEERIHFIANIIIDKIIERPEKRRNII